MLNLMISLALSGATAEPTAQNPAPATTTAKPEKPKKICRAGADTGSRLTNKICKTQSEWDAQMGADASKLDGKRDGASGY